MKLIQYAIASIVDANTGYALAQTGSKTDYAAAERRAHLIRSRSIADLATALRQRVAEAIESRRQKSLQRRELKHLRGLNDHLLRDIGLSRADLFAIEVGDTSFEALDAERKARAVHTQDARRVRFTSSETDKAANHTSHAASKCA